MSIVITVLTNNNPNSRFRYVVIRRAYMADGTMLFIDYKHTNEP